MKVFFCSFDVDHAGSGGRTPLDGSGGFPGVVLQSGMGYGGQGGGRRESRDGDLRLAAEVIQSKATILVS